MHESAVAPPLARALQPRLWWLWSVLLLAGLVGVSLAGALARVDRQRAGVEQFLRDRTGLDVRFSRLRIQLGFYGPEAVFSNVDFRQPGAAPVLLHAQSVTARFEYLSVLRNGDLQPGLITLRDADIYLDSLGAASAAASSGLAAAAESPQALGLLASLERRSFAQAARFAQVIPAARIRLENVALHLPRNPQSADAWALQSTLISLDQTAQGLRVVGTLRLPERLGESVWFRIDAPRDLVDSGSLQLRTRALAVTPWRELAGIPAELGGLLDLRVDARWSKSQLGSAQASLRWHVDDAPIDAQLAFDRASGVLTADAPRLPLAVMQQLWQAFDPAAQVLGLLDDVRPQGEVSNLHASWAPQAAPGARARVTAQLKDLGLASRSQQLQLAPLTVELRADERELRLQLSATAAELRRTGAAPGSGRLVALDALIENHGNANWSLALRSGSLGARRVDDPAAADRPLPELAQLQGELHWDLRGPWRGALQGQSAQQPFALRWQGDARQALLSGQSPGIWRARLRLARGGAAAAAGDSAGLWHTVAGRVQLGATATALRLPRREEILVGGRLAAAELLSLQPVLARWPRAADMPPWRGSVRVARLSLGGHALGAARLDLQSRDNLAALRIVAAPLAGDMRLAADGRWSVELQRAHLAADSRAALLAGLLAERIAATVAVADLRVGERRFGRLAMQVAPQGGTLQLRRVSLQGAASLRGSGSCQLANGRGGDCTLRLALRGEDLGAWMRETGQGTDLHGAALRGDLRVDWPMSGRAAWLDSLSGAATLSASAVSLAPPPDSSGSWAAGLQAIVTGAQYERLDANLAWQGSRFELQSAVLQQPDGQLTLSGRLDYGTRQIDEQLEWRPHALAAAIPDALATLESVARTRLPTLAGAMGDVGRWVSGSAAPQRWRVSGSIDAPAIEPIVAK